jgi:predicted outer membrane repeat protein
VDYGEVFINDTLFFNNTCMSSGAALYTTYSNVTVLGSNFLNNTANSAAGLKTYQTNVRDAPMPC